MPSLRWPAVALLACSGGVLPAAAAGSVARFVFGSCSDPRLPQPAWAAIAARQGDAFIWAGDIVYADQIVRFRNFLASESGLRALHAAQHAVPGYAELVASGMPILGVNDDHDFGINDGDRTFEGRNWSQRALLDFLREAPESPRRQRQGVYDARLFDFGSDRSVLVVLLDVRYFKDPWSAAPKGEMLGSEQWAWLRQLLCESTARAHLLVSGLQVLPEGRLGESWSKFPGERARLFALLQECQVAAPILISGDVHLAEISEAICDAPSGTEPRRYLAEVTSSGLTHAWGYDTAWRWTQQYFAGVPLLSKLLHWACGCFHALGAHAYRPQGGPSYFLGRNFGEVAVDWEANSLSARVFDVDGKERLMRSWPLAELAAGDVCRGGRDLAGPERAARGAAWAVAALAPLLLAVAACCACACACGQSSRGKVKRQ